MWKPVISYQWFWYQCHRNSFDFIPRSYSGKKTGSKLNHCSSDSHLCCLSVCILQGLFIRLLSESYFCFLFIQVQISSVMGPMKHQTLPGSFKPYLDRFILLDIISIASWLQDIKTKICNLLVLSLRFIHFLTSQRS